MKVVPLKIYTYAVVFSCSFTETSTFSWLSSTTVSNLDVTASGIIQRYLPFVYEVQFICEEACVTDQLLKSIPVPIHSTASNLRADSYVFLVPQTPAFVTSVLKRVANSTKSKYVCLLDCSECLSVEWIFQQCWQHKILNVVVVPVLNETLPIYTYFPFTKDTCFDMTPVLIDHLSSSLRSKNDLFPKRNVRNLHNCTLIVSSFTIYPAIYFENGQIKGHFSPVLNGLATSMNFVPEFIHTAGKDRTGDVSGPIKRGIRGDVYLGRADLGFQFMEPFDFHLLDYDSLAMTTCITWCVAASLKEKPFWGLMVDEFSPYVWLILFFSALGVLGVDDVIKKFDRGKWLFCDDMIMNAWVALLQGPSKMPQRKLKNTQRLLWIVWVMASLVLSTAYVSTLQSLRTAPHTEYAVQNLKDVADVGLQVYYAKGLADMVQDLGKSNPSMSKVQSKMVRFSTDKFQPIINLFRFKNITCLLTDLLCRILSSNFQGEVELYSLSDEPCLKVSPWHFFVLGKHSVFSEEISIVLGRMTQAGIVEKSLKQFSDLLEIDDFKKRPINVHDLLPPLMLLIAGLLVSCVVLLFEMLPISKLYLKNIFIFAISSSNVMLGSES